MKDSLNPPELAARLGKILAEHPDAEEVEALLTSQKLAQDVGYLIELLGEAGAEDRAALAAALERLTQQKLGADAAAWKKWWSQKRPPRQGAAKAN
jgi:hypothetical protein